MMGEPYSGPEFDAPPQMTMVPSADGSRMIPKISITKGPQPYDGPELDAPPSQAGQYAGLTARAAVQGVPSAIAGLPALAADAYDSLDNATRMGWNLAAPILGMKERPLLPSFRASQGVADLGKKSADILGLPQPQTKMQQGLVDIGTAASGAAGGAGIANLTARALPGAIPGMVNFMRELGSAPTLQTLGAVGGATATDFARREDMPPLAQLGLGVMGSMAPGAGATIGGRGAAGAFQAIKPFIQSGKEQIVGDILNTLSTTPNATAMRLKSAPVLVPGSLPTTAQASGDPGLIAGTIGAGAGMDIKSQLAMRASEQNTARQAELNRITMPQGPQNERGTLDYAQAKRDATVDQNMVPAFGTGQQARAQTVAMGEQSASGVGFADTKPILGKIDEILASTKGARKDVQDAMAFAKDRLTQPNVDLQDPETLYSIRKDLANARDGKYNSEKSNLALARGELGDVMSSLDDAIDNAAPGYRRYMELYKQRSIPLNQTLGINTLRARSENPIPDPMTGQRILAPGKFGVQLRKAIASGALGKGVGNANLSDSQIGTMQNVAQDLDRSAAASAATVRVPGSDTFRNYSIASIIGRVIGGGFEHSKGGRTAADAVATPLSWLYRYPDEAISELMVNAMLDPKLAGRLMENATQARVQHISTELASRMQKQMQGAVLHNTP